VATAHPRDAHLAVSSTGLVANTVRSHAAAVVARACVRHAARSQPLQRHLVDLAVAATAAAVDAAASVATPELQTTVSSVDVASPAASVAVAALHAVAAAAEVAAAGAAAAAAGGDTPGKLDCLCAICVGLRDLYSFVLFVFGAWLNMP
jgi:hypothetical protein